MLLLYFTEHGNCYQRIPREERGRSLRFAVRFDFALGEIYGPDRKFGLWGRSGGWHILQGRKDSRWAAVQNAACGHLRDSLIMGGCHRQASVAAAARRQGGCGRLMWTRQRRVGVCGEPGRPAGINKALGRRIEAAALQGSVGSSGDGRRAGELIFGPAVPGTRRHMWYFAAATPGGRLPTRRWPSVEQLALPAGCPGPRSWVGPGEAWRWRMGLGVREARGLRTFVQ